MTDWIKLPNGSRVPVAKNKAEAVLFEALYGAFALRVEGTDDHGHFVCAGCGGLTRCANEDVETSTLCDECWAKKSVD